MKLKLSEPRTSARHGKQLSKRQFNEECGDPARLIFKGQCYDAGPESERVCHACGQGIQHCYTLKLLGTGDLASAKEVGKAVIGECCFALISPSSQF